MKVAIYSLVLTVFITLFFACESDTISIPEVEVVREGTCFDGLLNGDEVIVDCGGECPGFCPPSSIGILRGEIVANLQLNPTVEYRLTGPLLIRKGRFSIPAGTVIKADPNVGAYIAIAQEGSLLVSGQPENPVVITSRAENPSPGDWGGIIVCGQGPLLSQEIGRTDIIDIFYGGTDVENSSGDINYLRVEYAGAMGETGQNFDAIAFYGVGAFTNITNVQTFESLGNGIRFIGGNADAKQLVSTNSGGNAIVIQDDWSGNGESWYLSSISSSGIEITTNEATEPISPITADTIRDISILGPTSKGGLHYSELGGKYFFTNVFTSALNLGIAVDGINAIEQIEMGNLKIDSIQFQNPASGFMPTNYPRSNSDFYQETPATGAGNGSLAPEWTNGWTIGLD